MEEQPKKSKLHKLYVSKLKEKGLLFCGNISDEVQEKDKFIQNKEENMSTNANPSRKGHLAACHRKTNELTDCIHGRTRSQ